MRACLALACLLGVAACTSPPPAPDAERELHAAVLALPGDGDPAEAARLATAALGATDRIRDRYRPVRPPQLGNLAFHLGLRERGLCCHYVEDLLDALTPLALTSFELVWGSAHPGQTLREHSAVVVVPRGARFEEGLVLDAWRDAGRLHWTPVATDRYPWVPHPYAEKNVRLRCSADLSR